MESGINFGLYWQIAQYSALLWRSHKQTDSDLLLPSFLTPYFIL